MPQDIYLIDDTVRRNVAFGLPDEEIDDERVWKALHAAQLDATVRALPGGLDAGPDSAAIACPAASVSGSELHGPSIATRKFLSSMRRPQISTARPKRPSSTRWPGCGARKTIIVIAHRFSV